MKITTFLSAGAFILFSAFVIQKEAANQVSFLYNTRWELKKIHKADCVETVTGNAFIRFNREKKSAGGHGGCNTFGSSIIVSGNKVSLNDIISTQMYCEEVQQTENAFFRQLEKVNRFVIKKKALLLYRNNEVLLEFASK